jgi:hypothetical protein
MSNDKIEKKNKPHKKIQERYLSQTKLTQLTYYLGYKIEIPQQKKSGTINEVNGPTTKYQMMILKKNQFLINNLQKRPNLIRPGSLDRDYHVGRQS